MNLKSENQREIMSPKNLPEVDYLAELVGEFIFYAVNPPNRGSPCVVAALCC